MSLVPAICPQCGGKIEVDPTKEAGICALCGAPFITEKAVAGFQAEELSFSELAETITENEDYRYVCEHLIDGVRLNPKYFVKNFNKKKYEESFYSYKHEIEKTYEAMDRCVVANPKGRKALLEAFVDRYLEQWEELRQDRKGETAAFSDKMTLALYEVPAILSMELSSGNDYVELLHTKFVAKYPKNIFQPGTYEEIAGGFRKRKFCFITTAICEFEGKPDDCAELTAFRNFRDGWLSDHGGKPLIEEYYEIAPAIVQAVDYCDDRAERYGALRRDYLDPCYAALNRGDMEACRDHYVKMVISLKNRYGMQ